MVVLPLRRNHKWPKWRRHVSQQFYSWYMSTGPPSTLPYTQDSSLGCCTRSAKSGSPATHRGTNSAPAPKNPSLENARGAIATAVCICGTDRRAQPAGEVRPRNMTTRSPSRGVSPGCLSKISKLTQHIESRFREISGSPTWIYITKLVTEDHGWNLAPSLKVLWKKNSKKSTTFPFPLLASFTTSGNSAREILPELSLSFLADLVGQLMVDSSISMKLVKLVHFWHDI